MSMMDPVADALISIKNAEMSSKKRITFRPASKLIGRILEVMKENNYINNYEYIEDKSSGYYKIKLSGNINDCKAIKPRYAVKKNSFEEYEKRFLPSKNIGILIVSTSSGVITHRQAKEKKTGGRLLAYVY